MGSSQRELGVHPIRISFVATLRESVQEWNLAAMTPPGTIAGRLATVTDRLRHLVLPPRRPERVFSRAVNLKMSNYARKVPVASSSRRRAK